MKYILKTIIIASLFSQGAYSASCDTDREQMYNQLSIYHSISTTGCPFRLGWGINRVLYAKDESPTTCSAICIYANSEVQPCSWEKGNWGDTLTCNDYSAY